MLDRCFSTDLALSGLYDDIKFGKKDILNQGKRQDYSSQVEEK